MYNAAIIDLDGTLIDSQAIARNAMEITFEKYGWDLSDVEIALMPGKSSRELIPIFLASRSITDAETCNLVIESYRRNHGPIWDRRVTLMPYAAEFLGTLHSRSIPLALATASRRETVKRFLNKFGFQDLFRVIVSQDDVEQSRLRSKIDLALNALNDHQATLRILGIEDSEPGVRLVKAAGLPCAAVPNVYTMHQSFAEADYIFPSLQNVVDLY